MNNYIFYRAAYQLRADCNYHFWGELGSISPRSAQHRAIISLRGLVRRGRITAQRAAAYIYRLRVARCAAGPVVTVSVL